MANPFLSVYLGWLRLKNSIDYPLRQRLKRFRAAPVSTSHPFHRDILSTYPEKNRHRVQRTLEELDKNFHFGYYSQTHSLDEIRENYYYLSLLDEALRKSDISLPESIRAADIGPSSWFYIHALHGALSWFDTPSRRQVQLTGFEVDAYRLYSDFHTRKDHALGNMQGLNGVDFMDHGFEVSHSTYDVITMFFPFVFEKDHLKWGLPGRMFDPRKLLMEAWQSLRPGGFIMIVNQGEEEHEAEFRAMAELDISVRCAFKVEPLLYSYPLDRYILTAVHE